jgi:ATP-binding cassette subfamily F protein 3
MLSVRNVHKAFGAQVIFDGATLQMNDGDRCAVVGPNGAGKSTLFRLLLGEAEPDTGDIVVRRGVRIGHLPQETATLGEGSVLAETLGGEDEHAAPDEKRTAQAKKVLMGLGFRTTDFDRPVPALSGGWRMRVAIARLLMENPDVMLLDEPTNHLDLESLLWFQDYLRYWRGALLLISHDRAFVNAVTDTILDLRDHRFFKYPGDYEKFVASRRQEEEQLIAAYDRQQKEIEDHEEFIARFRAQASKAPQVQSRIKMLEKIERIELPPEIKRVKIRFPQPARASARVIALKGASKSYGDLKVYEDLDFELERGYRAVLVGHNGAGKSTLLKMLAGVLPPDKGERWLGTNVRVGYYTQHRVEMLKPERTVIEEAQDTQRMNPDLFVRTVLGTFLFQGDTIYKKVAVLSGGEKSRLALVKLLLDPPNLLLLDEPTTHLDMFSVDALIDALKEFEGTLCFISHDLHFINSLAEHVVHVDAGKVTVYPGNYEYFQRRLAQKRAEGEDGDVPPEAAAPVRRPTAMESSSVKSTREDAKDIKDDQRRREKRRRRLNAEIREIEEEMTELNTQMASIFIKSDYQKLMHLDRLVKAYEKELAEKKAALAKTDGPA